MKSVKKEQKVTTKLHGQEAIKIVNLNVPKLLTMMNKAYADEWIAYYQYWVCAKLVEGPIRPQVVVELEEHAKEEYKHATWLADRIIQLGGLPLLNSDSWYKHAGCGYDATKNAYVKAVLEENIKAEQCAIRTYNEMLKFVEGKDHITYDIILKILEDEVEHEQDLTKLLYDLKAMEKIA